MEAQTKRVISSLCYFSIFFAGFIFPIAVYFIVDHKDVKKHAIHALVSHIIPLVTIPFLILLVVAGIVELQALPIIIAVILFGLINIVIVVWNVIKGIQVLKD